MTLSQNHYNYRDINTLTTMKVRLQFNEIF